MCLSVPAAHAAAQPVGIVIPGIGISYRESIDRLRAHPSFERNCRIAGIPDWLVEAPIQRNGMNDPLADTLANQKLSYVINCTMCDLLVERGVVPRHVIGYSMGLYAALYTGGYYSFETGLAMVEKAFDSVGRWCRAQPERFGMGILLGLSEEEVRALLLGNAAGEVDIAVHNGERSFVLAGGQPALVRIMEQATDFGAVSARLIQTDHPYHHRCLEPIAPGLTRELRLLEILRPKTGVMSLLDGKLIAADEVVSTVVRALHSPLRFDSAIRRALREHQVRLYYETGPERSMGKLMRYIDRSIRVRGLGEL